MIFARKKVKFDKNNTNQYPMGVRSLSAYQTRIYQFVFGLAIVLISLYAIRSMMGGQTGTAKMIAFLLVATAVVFALDDKFLMLYPICDAFSVRIPGMPFTGNELGCLSVITVYFVRLCIHRERSAHFLGRNILPTLPFMSWVALVFLMNPPGMFLLGSDSIGGRFYFKIMLGFLTMIVFSTKRFSESEAKCLFFCLVVANFLALGRSMVFGSADPDAGAVIGGEAPVSIRYGLISAGFIYTLCLSKWSISAILSSPPKFFLTGTLAILALLSGKRRMIGVLFLAPFFRAFLTRRDRLATAIVSAFAMFFLLFGIAGDGTLWTIPKSATRVLSVISPKYARSSADGGVHDLFRATLRDHAREVIRNNPWFGRKGFAMSLEETILLNSSGSAKLGEGHALSGNWHSTWYGFAADFGIPSAVFWAFFCLHVWKIIFSTCKSMVSFNSFLSASFLYYSFFFLTEFSFSYTSGHSSLTPMSQFAAYGILLALSRGISDVPSRTGTPCLRQSSVA